MFKKVLVFVAGAMMLAAPAVASEVSEGPMNVTSKFKLSIGGFARLDYVFNSQNLGNLGFLLPNGGLADRRKSRATTSVYRDRPHR